MTVATAGIAEGLTFFRDELPVITFGMEGELEHAERVRLVRFAVGNEVGENAMRVLAARTYDKFANAMLGISFSVWILECEAFVIMIVAVNHDVCAGVIQNLPEWLDLNVIAMR